MGALIFHGLFMLLLLALSYVEVKFPWNQPPPKRRQTQAVALRGLTPEQWAKNRGTANPFKQDNSKSGPVATKEPPKQPEEKKKEEVPKGQVVDVPPGNDEQDENAKYLAEHSNKVKHESKAKNQTPFYRNAMPRRTTTTPQQGSGQDNVEKAQIAGNNGLANDDRPLKNSAGTKGSFEVPNAQRRQEIALRDADKGPGPGAQVSNQSESAQVQGNSSRLRIVPGTGGQEEETSQGKRGLPGIASLSPSMAVMDKLSGAAPNDHLSDVDEGEGTYLNTKEWKYASFFNRVKQSVGMHWDPSTPMRMRDPTGNIYGGRDRYTVVNVTLNERGMVKDVYVEKSCGLDFLDLEAIKSFERAQPFPNPPPGLMGSDKGVHFTFGFFLEMGGGPRLRLFRSAN